MSTLSNFPLYSQRNTVLRDGTLDTNHDYDCVPTSLAMALTYFTGRHFEGGALKEDVYGRDYQGTMAATSFVQLLTHYGVKLYPIDASYNEQLVILAHGHIKAGHAVIFSEIDPYCTPYERDVLGWSHVVVAMEEEAGTITVADPFIAQSVTKSDEQWAADLMFHEIWVLEKIEESESMAISLSTAGVGQYFTQAPGGAWHCAKYDATIGGAILTYYRTLGNSGLCGLTVLGLPTSNEYSLNVPGHPEIVGQHLEHADVIYDPKHVYDNPPASGPVYLAHQQITQANVKQALAKVLDLTHKITVIEQICKS